MTSAGASDFQQCIISETANARNQITKNLLRLLDQRSPVDVGSAKERRPTKGHPTKEDISHEQISPGLHDFSGGESLEEPPSIPTKATTLKKKPTNGQPLADTGGLCRTYAPSCLDARNCATCPRTAKRPVSASADEALKKESLKLKPPKPSLIYPFLILTVSPCSTI